MPQFNLAEIVDILNLANILGFKNSSSSIYFTSLDLIRDDLLLKISIYSTRKSMTISKVIKFTNDNIPEEMIDIRKKDSYSISSSLVKGKSFDEDKIEYKYTETLFQKDSTTHGELMSIIRDYFIDEIRDKKLELLEV